MRSSNKKRGPNGQRREDIPTQPSYKPQQNGAKKIKEELNRSKQAPAKDTYSEHEEEKMEHQQQDVTSSSDDIKVTTSGDEIIYSRVTDAEAPSGGEEVAEAEKDDDTEVKQTEEPQPADDEPVNSRSFMDEMYENDGEFSDEYVDMPSYDDLVAENAKLRRQLTNVIAQYENLKQDWNKYRKRAKLEMERNKNLASERVATQIIPVIDDLNRSIEHLHTMGEELIPVANGNVAIANRIIAALAKEGIEVISPLGEPFDANRHQAIAIQEVEGKRPGIVFHVYQDGYAIGNRVIRPASVGVTK